MKARENEKNRANIRFDTNNIVIATKMLDAMKTTIDIVYYLMNRGDERSFVVMLVSAENMNVEAFMEKEKRTTDILFEIDEESSLYAMICQDTKIDGGYHLGERILNHMQTKDAEDIYIVELEIRTTQHDIKYIIFKLMETFIAAVEEGKSGEIVFKSLN